MRVVSADVAQRHGLGERVRGAVLAPGGEVEPEVAQQPHGQIPLLRVREQPLLERSRLQLRRRHDRGQQLAQLRAQRGQQRLQTRDPHARLELVEQRVVALPVEADQVGLVPLGGDDLLERRLVEGEVTLLARHTPGHRAPPFGQRQPPHELRRQLHRAVAVAAQQPHHLLPRPVERLIAGPVEQLAQPRVDQHLVPDHPHRRHLAGAGVAAAQRHVASPGPSPAAR